MFWICTRRRIIVLLFALLIVWVFTRCRHSSNNEFFSISTLVNKFTSNEPPPLDVRMDGFVDDESKAMIMKLRDSVVSLNPTKLRHLQFQESSSTMIDNKSIVFLCVRDPKTGKLYDWNALIYVVLHECAHAISEGYDPEHKTPEFRNNFNTLLRDAELRGIYDPKKPFVEEYCHLTISPEQVMIR